MTHTRFQQLTAALLAAVLAVFGPLPSALAATLEGVEAGRDEVSIYLSEPVKFNAFTTSDPPRLVLELLDTEYAAASEYADGEGRYLQRVRAGQYQREPSLVSRVVLYLSELVSYRASWEGAELSVVLEASDLPRKAAAAAAAAVVPIAAPAEAAPAAPKVPRVKLEQIAVEPDAVTIRLNGKTKFNAFTTDDPARLIIEFSGTENAASTEYLPGKGKVLRRVRTGQFQPEPDPTTRVVLYLNQLVAYEASWEETSLKVSLSAPVSPAPVPAAAPAVKAPVPAPAPVAAAAPVAPAASERVKLSGVSVEKDGVLVRLSGKTKFNVFTTEKPARLIVELSGTEFSGASESLPGKGKLIQKVRSGQFQSGADPAARVVLELSQLVGYGAEWDGTNLRVSLDAVQAAPVPVPAVAAKPAVSVPVVPMPVVPMAAAPAPAVKPAAAPRESASLPATMTTTASQELEQIAMAGDYDKVEEIDGESAPAESAPAARSQSSKTRLRRDILATLPTDPISIDLDDEDVRNVMNLLATKAKINIVYGNEVAGTMSLHLQDVPFNEAFMTALSMQNLIPTQVGENILRVVTPTSLATAKLAGVTQTKVIPLRYQDGATLLPTIVAMRMAELRTGGVVHDTKQNAFIITDSLEGISSLERVLTELDVRPQQVMIETKLVEVNLSKASHFGIQWDYYAMDRGELLGQKGTNVIGSPVFVPTDVTTFAKPFDVAQKVGVTGVIGGLSGASGRGTGVSLPASAINGALTLGRVTNNYYTSATLTAAASAGKAKVLSDPKITALNNQPANINILTKTPYVTASVTSTGVQTQSVNYVDTGISLRVTPTINADGRVTLKVEPTVSQPSATAPSAGVTGAIGIDSRSALTTVMVQDGETIVIGGLITDSVSDVVAKVPLLGDIPLLGWLFKKKSKTRTRVELLIFVTTRIINT